MSRVESQISSAESVNPQWRTSFVSRASVSRTRRALTSVPWTAFIRGKTSRLLPLPTCSSFIPMNASIVARACQRVPSPRSSRSRTRQTSGRLSLVKIAHSTATVTEREVRQDRRRGFREAEWVSRSVRCDEAKPARNRINRAASILYRVAGSVILSSVSREGACSVGSALPLLRPWSSRRRM